LAEVLCIESPHNHLEEIFDLALESALDKKDPQRKLERRREREARNGIFHAPCPGEAEKISRAFWSFTVPLGDVDDCWLRAIVALIGHDRWWKINDPVEKQDSASPPLCVKEDSRHDSWVLRTSRKAAAVQFVDRRVEAARSERLGQRSCVGEEVAQDRDCVGDADRSAVVGISGVEPYRKDTFIWTIRTAESQSTPDHPESDQDRSVGMEGVVCQSP
jgi:hypothetical protein